jgi:DNA polymerase-1
MACIGPAEVRARYGVEPWQVPDFIALRGDASDRIPGASGVGAIGAASLLRKYGALERLLATGRFAPQADQLRLYPLHCHHGPESTAAALAQSEADLDQGG